MLLKALQLTIRNMRCVTQIVSNESSISIQFQKYSRFSQRHPVAIVNEDELFDIDMKNTTPQKVQRKPKSQSSQISHEIEKENEQILKEVCDIETKKQKNQSQKKFKNDKKSKIEEEESSQPKTTVFTKLYQNTKLVSSIMMSLRSKRNRKKNEQILIEGTRFIRDAVEAKMIPETIIFSRWEDIKDISFQENQPKMYKVPYRTIQLWSTLTTAPGVMGIFKKPEPLKISKSSLPITIICDNVRDPGNMGSILRAAAGVGCEKILLSKGCVDFWDTKVLRSAAGAHFRIPIFGSQEWHHIKSSISDDAHVYIADNNAESYVNDESELLDNVSEKDIDNEYHKQKLSKEEKINSELTRIKMNNIPVIPYFAVDYTRNEVVIIIGGETTGLSKESFDLLENRQGIRVNIPLFNGVDSLNAGMALGIIAFEVKRQFLMIKDKLNQLE